MSQRKFTSCDSCGSHLGGTSLNATLLRSLQIQMMRSGEYVAGADLCLECLAGTQIISPQLAAAMLDCGEHGRVDEGFATPTSVLELLQARARAKV